MTQLLNLPRLINKHKTSKQKLVTTGLDFRLTTMYYILFTNY